MSKAPKSTCQRYRRLQFVADLFPLSLSLSLSFLLVPFLDCATVRHGLMIQLKEKINDLALPLYMLTYIVESQPTVAASYSSPRWETKKKEENNNCNQNKKKKRTKHTSDNDAGNSFTFTATHCPTGWAGGSTVPAGCRRCAPPRRRRRSRPRHPRHRQG